MSIPLFDCHCDTIARAYDEHQPMRNNGFQLDLERLSRYSPCAQVFAVCTELEHNSKPKAAEELLRLRSELHSNSDLVKLCLSYSDIVSAVNDGKIAALISVEGAEQIESLESAYNDGVRIIHLTWNYDNKLCGAACASGRGLTEKGGEFVRKAQKMGILLDMSHISERGFFDVLRLAEKPVIAGHSNAKALCDVPRNLTDAQFMSLVSIGGGAGINLFPEFLGLSRDVDAVIAHIEHFLSLGGEKSVFLGCDLDGIDCPPQGIDGVQDIEKIYNGLLRRNYSESLVRDIFWNNIYNIMERTL